MCACVQMNWAQKKLKLNNNLLNLMLIILSNHHFCLIEEFIGKQIDQSIPFYNVYIFYRSLHEILD